MSLYAAPMVPAAGFLRQERCPVFIEQLAEAGLPPWTAPSETLTGTTAILSPQPQGGKDDWQQATVNFSGQLFKDCIALGGGDRVRHPGLSPPRQQWP